jgi:hypothetical protein
VKKLALLSVAALMLASSVFAPVAMAQEQGEVEIQSVTVQPDGDLTVTGTIQCTERWSWDLRVIAVQGTKPDKFIFDPTDPFKKFKSPKPGLKLSTTETFGRCETTGPISFTTELFGGFDKGKIWVGGQTFMCGGSPFRCVESEFNFEGFKIR